MPKCGSFALVSRVVLNQRLTSERALSVHFVILGGLKISRHTEYLAAAVAPEIILMDEPASSLDLIAPLAIEELIRELRHDYSIVIVTHNTQQAARVSDETALMMVCESGSRCRGERSSTPLRKNHAPEPINAIEIEYQEYGERKAIVIAYWADENLLRYNCPGKLEARRGENHERIYPQPHRVGERPG